MTGGRHKALSAPNLLTSASVSTHVLTTVPANSDAGMYLTLVTVHGRCTCPDDICHEEGPACCRLCAVLDGEYPCPSDPTAIDAEVYPDPDLVKIEGAAR